ncbi:MAG: nicotinate (nicotinamide) nucleotide adenylyltransferase [Deltaproteobacteria bacterium]|nr:nicotinate (nicotinamide) nucleotide adenylyltransferase [Deltaproteobacteria bacterium]
MTTVALYGGSFNPPHVAHQLLTLLVLETTDIDEVWWVPTHQHAFGKELAPWADRLAMCRLAVERFSDAVRVNEIEAAIAGESRTIRTLEALRARHPDHSFRLLVGADILTESHLWYRWDEIVAVAPPLVVAREGHPSPADALPAVPAVSSTEIRERLARGDSAVPLVSRSVMDYIAARELYR